MKQSIQQIGEQGEKDLLNILNDLLTNFSRISSLRRSDAGFQEGKDIKVEGVFNKKHNEIAILGEQKYKWFFEVKNYKSKLDAYKISGKITQLCNSQYKFDIFCIFSPHEDFPSLWEDTLTQEKIFNIPQYPFGIVLWTPSTRIKENLKAFPDIYERIYGDKIDISDKEKYRLQREWINEIKIQTDAGNKKQIEFVNLFKGNNAIWIPESIEDAKKCLSDSGNMKEDGQKANRLRKKLSYGGVNSEIDIMNAKNNRLLSEAIRRKNRKTNERFYSRLNSLRYELYNFCCKIEKTVLTNNKRDEAIAFIKHFENEIVDFKSKYKDSTLIDRLPDFYYVGQMYDITGECLLSLSNKWLKEVNDKYGSK